MSPIKVLLVDDHPVVQLGLGQALSALPDIDVVAVSGNAAEAMDKACQMTPDIVLLDLNMPGMNGIEATRLLKENLPDVRVVIFSMHDEESFIQQAFQAGAVGYVLKGAPVSEVANALRKTSQGAYYLCTQLQNGLIQDFFNIRQTTPEEKSYDRLTDREQQILRLLVNGHSTGKIGEKLFISPKTVETHRANIMQKLGVDSLIELIKYCMRINILDPHEWIE